MLPSDTAPIDHDLGLVNRRPNAPSRAIDGYRAVAEDLLRVWPHQPDEARVRYYIWASRRLRAAQDQIKNAWALLDEAGFWMSTLGEDLVRFTSTGDVPVIEDGDLLAETEVVAHGPVHAPAPQARPQAGPALVRALPALPAPPVRGVSTQGVFNALAIGLGRVPTYGELSAEVVGVSEPRYRQIKSRWHHRRGNGRR